MVGVPFLLRWDSGPSLRITWPNFMICRRRMRRGPIQSATTRPVMIDKMARNVR